MSLIATAKNKAAKGSVAAAFKNEAGAIDLASIMVGIIVIGLIGGVIAATVFAVIPWAQNNAAKQQLDSVAAAQSAFIGLTASATGAAATLQLPGVTGTINATGNATPAITAGQTFYGTATQLTAASLLPAVTGLDVKVSGSGTTAHYGAAVTSASGAVFYIGDRKTQPTQAPDGTAVGAASTLGLNNQ